MSVERRHIKSEFYSDNPAHHTRSQILTEKKQKARRDAGLLENNDEILKSGANDPGVGWQDKPNVKSQSDLLNARRKEQHSEFKKMEQK